MTSPYQAENGMKECLYVLYTEPWHTGAVQFFFLVHIYFYLFTIYLSLYT